MCLDGKILYEDQPTAHAQQISFTVDDDVEQHHTISFELLGKMPEHTKLDQYGNIIEDRIVKISDIIVGQIAMESILPKVAEYSHDHNGTTDLITQPFYGVMGCNGRVTMCFHTPVYLWLLEHMWR